jgi:hypothetical protein
VIGSALNVMVACDSDCPACSSSQISLPAPQNHVAAPLDSDYLLPAAHSLLDHFPEVGAAVHNFRYQ